jgi:hypothetical protein
MINYVNLPLFSESFYDYSISLEGNSYILQFTYNERSKLYYLSLLDADYNEIVVGCAVVPYHPIMQNYAIDNLSGFFWMEPKSDLVTDSYIEYPDKIHEFYNMYYIYITEE